MLNAARARRQQQTGWLSQAPTMLGSGYRNTSPILPAACGDLLSFADAMQHAPIAYIDPIARNRIAHIISDAWAQQNRVQDQALPKAKMIGELTVGWETDYPRTPEGMVAARTQLMTILRSMPIVPQEVTTMIRDIVTQTRRAIGTGTVPRAELIRYVQDVPEINEISKAFLEFAINGGHLIINAFLSNADNIMVDANGQVMNSRDIWMDLKAFRAQDPVLPEGDLTLVDNIQAAYAAMTNIQLLGFWEAMAYANRTQNNRRTLGAAAVFVVAMCKSSNETEAYIDRRIRALETEFPGVDITSIFNQEVIRAFCELYAGQDITVNTLYKSLMPLYTAFGGTKLQSLTWVMEQAIGANCTSVIAFAESAIEQGYRPVQVLLGKLTAAQWQNYIRACYVIIRNPWGQIRRPTYPASSYKDLTNYGRYARRKQDQKFTPYSGGFIAGGEMTEKQIRQIYDACKEQADAAAAVSMSLETEFRRWFPNLEIIYEDESFYIHNGTDTPLDLDNLVRQLNLNQQPNAAPAGQPERPGVAGPAPVEVAADRFRGLNLERGPQDMGQGGNPFEDAQEQREEQQRRLVSMRRGWAANTRQLPLSASKLNMADLLTLIQRRWATDPRYQGAVELLGQVRVAVSQEVLTPWTGDNDVTLRTRYRPATDAVKRSVQAFGLEPNDIVPEVPGDDVAQPAENYNEQAMDNQPMWSRPARAITQ